MNAPVAVLDIIGDAAAHFAAGTDEGQCFHCLLFVVRCLSFVEIAVVGANNQLRTTNDEQKTFIGVIKVVQPKFGS